MNLMNRKEGWKNIRREGECSPFMGGGESTMSTHEPIKRESSTAAHASCLPSWLMLDKRYPSPL